MTIAEPLDERRRWGVQYHSGFSKRNRTSRTCKVGLDPDGDTHTRWLTRLWGPASLKVAGQARRLEVQSGADAAVLRQNFFSLRENSFCP